MKPIKNIKTITFITIIVSLLLIGLLCVYFIIKKRSNEGFMQTSVPSNYADESVILAQLDKDPFYLVYLEPDSSNLLRLIYIEKKDNNKIQYRTFSFFQGRILNIDNNKDINSIELKQGENKNKWDKKSNNEYRLIINKGENTEFSVLLAYRDGKNWTIRTRHLGENNNKNENNILEAVKTKIEELKKYISTSPPTTSTSPPTTSTSPPTTSTSPPTTSTSPPTTSTSPPIITSFDTESAISSQLGNDTFYVVYLDDANKFKQIYIQKNGNTINYSIDNKTIYKEIYNIELKPEAKDEYRLIINKDKPDTFSHLLRYIDDKPINNKIYKRKLGRSTKLLEAITSKIEEIKKNISTSPPTTSTSPPTTSTSPPTTSTSPPKSANINSKLTKEAILNSL